MEWHYSPLLRWFNICVLALISRAILFLKVNVRKTFRVHINFSKCISFNKFQFFSLFSISFNFYSGRK